MKLAFIEQLRSENSLSFEARSLVGGDTPGVVGIHLELDPMKAKFAEPVFHHQTGCLSAESPRLVLRPNQDCEGGTPIPDLGAPQGDVTNQFALDGLDAQGSARGGVVAAPVPKHLLERTVRSWLNMVVESSDLGVSPPSNKPREVRISQFAKLHVLTAQCTSRTIEDLTHGFAIGHE